MEVRMRVLVITSVLAFFIAPVSLFAQQGGRESTTATTSASTSFGESYEGVQNVSAQAQGTFIGGGRPTGFVGTTEIYNSSSSRVPSSTRQTAARTTVRPATTATQRLATTSAARAGQVGNINNQTIRSASSIDFDVTMPSQRIQPTAVATHLNRMPGIQGSQVTFRSSPSGTTAVLTGTVASNRERRVAQQLLLLEPGVNKVENLLEVR